MLGEDQALSNWPKAKIILALMNGTAEVFTPSNFPGPVKGVKSASPWVFASAQGVVVCSLCGGGERFPDPPVNHGLGEESKILFNFQTLLYANYLLTTLLNPFYKTHLACLVEPDVEESK